MIHKLQELKLSLKYLGKRYGMSDVRCTDHNLKFLICLYFQLRPWQDAMNAADVNGDGSLSFLEFQDAIKMAEEAVLAALAAKN